MGKTKDRDTIWDAAESWLNELEEYIVPGVLTKEERKSYRKQADKLKNAMARESERLRRKALRDQLKPVVKYALSSDMVAEGWTNCPHCGQPIRRTLIGGSWRHFGHPDLYVCPESEQAGRDG